MGSRLAVGWLVLIALELACGRVGFETQQSVAVDAADPDAPPGSRDAPAAADAMILDDGALACGYTGCGPGNVTCCDSGTPACVLDTDPCARRFECEQPANTGCFGGEMCCIRMDMLGTECVNIATEPCFG